MIRTAFLLTAGGLTAATALAQGTEPGGEYVIQGIFSPTIADARKIDMEPERIDTILPEIPVRYDLLPAMATIEPHVDSIAAAKIKVDPALSRLYKGYIKGGFGLYTTPLGEVYVDQTRSRENAWGFHAKHFSSNGGLDDVGPSDYSYNSIDGFYKQFLPNHEASGRLMYDRRRVSYYGYVSNDSIEDALAATEPPQEDFVKQFYNDIGFAARIRSLYKDSTKIAHDVALEVHSFSNLTGSRETNMRINVDLAMEDGNETYAAGLLIDNDAYRGVLDEPLGDFRQSGTLIGLTPNASTRGDKYLVRVGAGIYIDSWGETTFHFFPQVYASYSLFDDILVPYVGIDGERQRNSFRSLAHENPWLTGAPSLSNSSKMYDVYGGIRGSFSNDLGFDVRVSSSQVKDKALYVSVANAPYGDRMAVVYDRVDILDLSGELHYHMREALNVTARIDVNTYDVEHEAEAWNLPPYQLAFGATYDLRGKLILKGEAQFVGRRMARSGLLATDTEHPEGNGEFATVELDGFLDLYFGAEYRYTKRLSVFFDVSNLSASKYERWYQYPVQRTLFLGGATYAF
ncbi:MAG: hypothetical protein ABI432_19310 [Flavobacteriales bacterium]